MKVLALVFCFSVLFNVLLWFPLLLRTVLIRRERRIQDEHYKIVVCATKYQRYLIERKILAGQLTHDIHYEAMNSAQIRDIRISLYRLLCCRSAQFRETYALLEKEMTSLPKDMQIISQNFIAAYSEMIRLKQPILYSFVVAWAIMRFVYNVARYAYLLVRKKYAGGRHALSLKKMNSLKIPVQPQKPGKSLIIVAGLVSSRRPEMLNRMSFLQS